MKKLNGPYQIRHTQEGKFVVWSHLTNESVSDQELEDFEAHELADKMNVAYHIDHMEAQS